MLGYAAPALVGGRSPPEPLTPPDRSRLGLPDLSGPRLRTGLLLTSAALPSPGWGLTGRGGGRLEPLSCCSGLKPMEGTPGGAILCPMGEIGAPLKSGSQCFLGEGGWLVLTGILASQEVEESWSRALPSAGICLPDVLGPAAGRGDPGPPSWASPRQRPSFSPLPKQGKPPAVIPTLGQPLPAQTCTHQTKVAQLSPCPAPQLARLSPNTIPLHPLPLGPLGAVPQTPATQSWAWGLLAVCLEKGGGAQAGL